MAAKDKANAGPPTAGPKADLPKPIGVPEGYQALQPPVGTPEQRGASPGGARPVVDRPEYGPQLVAPRYYEGAELAPASASGEDIAEIQLALVEAGVLTGKYRFGVWDEQTKNAYKNVLELANQQGIDDISAMRLLANAPQAGGPAAAPRAPLQVQLSNPDDLRLLFEDAFRQAYGRKMRPEELGSFVSDYQARERAVQEQAYAMDDPNNPQGGTIVEPPSASSAAQVAAEGVNPAERGAYDMLGTYERALNFMTRSGVGSA